MIHLDFDSAAERDIAHLRAVMAALTLGDVHAADEYLRGVLIEEGTATYEAVCHLVAIRCKIPPKDIPRT